MTNKTVLITGATSGIGKASALSLAQLNTSLILLGRNSEKGKKLLTEIRQKTGNDKIKFYKADFSLMREVKAVTEKINNDYLKIDVLINNAGGRFLNHKISEEGIEQTLAVNYLSHFLLTNLLLHKLKAAPSARIINIASGTHYGSKRVIENITQPESYNGKWQYSDSKLAMVLFTYKLAEHLAGSKIIVNTIDPGGVATNFARNNGFFNWMKHRIYYLIKRELLTPEQGAETVIYLAISPKAETVSGKYFFNKKEKLSSEISYDKEIQKRLWGFSMELFNATFFEKR